MVLGILATEFRGLLKRISLEAKRRCSWVLQRERRVGRLISCGKWRRRVWYYYKNVWEESAASTRSIYRKDGSSRFFWNVDTHNKTTRRLNAEDAIVRASRRRKHNPHKLPTITLNLDSRNTKIRFYFSQSTLRNKYGCEEEELQVKFSYIKMPWCVFDPVVLFCNTVRWTFKYLNKAACCRLYFTEACSSHTHTHTQTFTRCFSTALNPFQTTSCLHRDLKQTGRGWLVQEKDHPSLCILRPLTGACLVRGWWQGDECKQQQGEMKAVI